ncbi:MAG: allophycocyanin subunit beta, partial [Microcystis sp. M53598_WE2]|nr:allophycocyanin subunit beta [Microcystis sp. M53598_WE2]
VRGIQIMSEMIQTMATEAGIADTSLIAEPFDHLTRELSEVSI